MSVQSKNITIQCATCGKSIAWDKELSPWRPFCSDRCKLIDLGNWADESNCIPGESIMPENLEESQQ